MVEAQTASAPAVTPPSMGPPSIAYVPPITLEEAVVRARVRIRHRNRRGARALIVALILFSLPLLGGLSALFPSDPLAKVSSSAFLTALLLTAVFLFLCWAAYRILKDFAGVTYAVLVVGAALIAYYAYTMWNLVTSFQAASATKFMDPNSLYMSLAIPALACATGAIAIVAALIAIPRPVRIADAA